MQKPLKTNHINTLAVKSHFYREKQADKSITDKINRLGGIISNFSLKYK